MRNKQSFDDRGAHIISKWGQGLSRRGVLAGVGKLLMWAGGVSVVPLLPLDRSVVDAQSVGCSDWRLCGIYGNLCKSCCNEGAQLFRCPQCTNIGSWWQKCCQDGSQCEPVRKNVKYYDCCGTKSGWTAAQAAACKGSWCARNSPQPAWCASGQEYRCTYIYLGSSC